MLEPREDVGGEGVFEPRAAHYPVSEHDMPLQHSDSRAVGDEPLRVFHGLADVVEYAARQGEVGVHERVERQQRGGHARHFQGVLQQPVHVRVVHFDGGDRREEVSALAERVENRGAQGGV